MNKLNILAILYATGTKAVIFDGLDKSSKTLTQLTSKCETSYVNGFCGGVGGFGGCGNGCGNNLCGYRCCPGYPVRPYQNSYC